MACEGPDFNRRTQPIHWSAILGEGFLAFTRAVPMTAQSVPVCCRLSDIWDTTLREDRGVVQNSHNRQSGLVVASRRKSP